MHPVLSQHERREGNNVVTTTVLETVLDQLELTPAEYFQRLTQSLEEGRLERLHRASLSRDTDAFVQEEVAAPSLTVLPDEEMDELTFAEPGEEEPLAPAASTAASRARPKKAARPRPARPAEGEEEDELAEFGLEPLDEDESQFRQAYRRALRTNRRPFRDR